MKVINFLKANWKTSIAGLLTATVGFLVVKGYIDDKTAVFIGTLITGVGFLLAKDAGNTPPGSTPAV